MNDTVGKVVEGFHELNSAEMAQVHGGYGWEDYIYGHIIDAVAEAAWVMGQVGGGFQQSLPAYLKK